MFLLGGSLFVCHAGANKQRLLPRFANELDARGKSFAGASIRNDQSRYASNTAEVHEASSEFEITERSTQGKRPAGGDGGKQHVGIAKEFVKAALKLATLREGVQIILSADGKPSLIVGHDERMKLFLLLEGEYPLPCLKGEFIRSNGIGKIFEQGKVPRDAPVFHDCTEAFALFDG